jgi:hypothetical protein
MKILELPPERYGWGIALMSLGAADGCEKKLVDEDPRRGLDSESYDRGCVDEETGI